MKLVLELLNRKREILKLSNKIDSRRQGRDVEDPARVLPAPAAQGHQGGARRDGRGGGGARRAGRAAQEGRPAARRREGRAARSSTGSRPSPPPRSEYTVARTYLDWIADLPWTQADRGQPRHRERPQHARRRPLRPREGQEAHPRVPGRAQAQERHARAHPLLRRAARRRQDLARASPSRGPSAASSCACRSAACATRPRSAATGAPTSARCPAASSRR